MPRVSKYSDFPSVYTCNLCNKTKPIEEMIVQFHRKEKIYRLRPRCKDCHNARERGYLRENHEALLIQGRMRRKGMSVTIAEAHELLKIYGRCYPTRFGLSQKGLKRCEQIRSRLRNRKAKKIDLFQIRLIVYEEALEDTSFMIVPAKQPIPFQSASARLKQYHRNQRIINET